MLRTPHASPGRRRFVGVLAALLLIAIGGALAARARAAGNASSAAGFIEDAQHSDGGFAATKGGPSDPGASLWATVALLAAGKNPQSERVNNGASADDYLAAHLSSYRSLTDLGVLAIVQAASGAAAGRYGDPAAELKSDETIPAIRADPSGAAMGAIGLLALRANASAAATARTLLGDALSDGGWGAGGDSDSASTALALEAIAQSGVATSSNPVVEKGISYLHRAQVNDGSIATSDRTDSSSSGDVAATAFTIQALAALHHATLRTPTGTTVLQGLASYQQLSSGGLSPFGAYDTGVAPSVIQTAQAYPAFDGVAFPLPYVAPAPAPKKMPATHAPATAPNRTSAGTTSSGVSSNTPSSSRTIGAYRGASAAGSAKSKAGRAPATSGSRVTGTVVGAPAAPKLTTRSGRPPAKNYTALLLALALLAVAVLGAAVDLRRPRKSTRSPAATVVQAAADLLAAARRRRAFVPAAVVLVGAALIATPSVTGMWSRAPRGAAMIRAFAPYMRESRLARLSDDLAVLDSAFRGAPGAFAHQWPAIGNHFATLLSTISANRGNYSALASLPSFGLFPWFLVWPGAALVLLGGIALVWPRSWPRVRLAVAVAGAGLVLAPLAFGLFDAAPRGGHLLSAFAPVETHANVTALQNDFSALVVGESSLAVGSAAHAPAVAELNRRWVTILGDYTPVLGVMSDNVRNYDAVAALPALSSFPWLFTIGGLIAIVLALLGRPKFRIRLRRTAAAEHRLQARSSA
jgi:hypothetical protein